MFKKLRKEMIDWVAGDGGPGMYVRAGVAAVALIALDKAVPLGIGKSLIGDVDDAPEAEVS
ncbi:hypothetical protein ABZ915_30805 [Streptomyces sp. NPDC046915]|uniref:hypothetical protein n=1 Tax=Streptomyces sp. NPDC046915 TaxID=3155257 RepID=UPI0033F08FDE